MAWKPGIKVVHRAQRTWGVGVVVQVADEGRRLRGAPVRPVSVQAEVAEKAARSIKYQLTIAKLPLAKDLDNFRFEGTPINETLVRDLAGGGFPRPAAQCRAGRWHRHRQNPSRHCDSPKLHSWRRSRPVL